MPRRPAAIPPPAEAEVQRSILASAPLWGVILRRQNTGAAVNPRGRLVRYGEKGASDLIGMTGPTWGPLAGRVLAIEVKKGRWKPPRKPKPGKAISEKRAHWERQLARLREVNANGGYGFWTDDVDECDEIVGMLREGWRVELRADEQVTMVHDEDE